MKKRIVIGLAAGAVLALGLLGCQSKPAEETLPRETAAPEETTAPQQTVVPEETLPPLPDSILYYGEIQEIVTDEAGKPSQLWMESPRDGQWVMNLGEPTVYVDSGKRIAFDPAQLKTGDRVYVFHSPMAARTLPPQSPAFAILAYMPMDASCGMYHEVEEILEEDGKTLIVTDNGSKTLGLDSEAKLFTYGGEEASAEDLAVGSHVIAWYWDRGEAILSTPHLMLLP